MKELIYAAALLHDCGRFRQYEDSTPHELAGAQLAEEILLIAALRNRSGRKSSGRFQGTGKKLAQEESLRGVLYRADKKSRPCFACPAEGACSWPPSKRTFCCSGECCVPSPCHFLRGVRRCPPFLLPAGVPRVRTGKWGISNRSVILFCCQSGANSSLAFVKQRRFGSRRE
ncbi:MAG: HD domain-containing protein [Eisenbergiella massiliensis]